MSVDLRFQPRYALTGCSVRSIMAALFALAVTAAGLSGCGKSTTNSDLSSGPETTGPETSQRGGGGDDPNALPIIEEAPLPGPYGSFEGEIGGSPLETTKFEGGYLESIQPSGCIAYRVSVHAIVGTMKYKISLMRWTPLEASEFPLPGPDGPCSGVHVISGLSTYETAGDTFEHRYALDDPSAMVTLEEIDIDLQAAEAHVVISFEDVLMDPVEGAQHATNQVTFSGVYEVTLPVHRQDLREVPAQPGEWETP